MTSLVDVHIKVKELSQGLRHIPVVMVLDSFEDNPEMILDHLQFLTFIDYVDSYSFKTGWVLLTLNGRLTIPFKHSAFARNTGYAT